MAEILQPRHHLMAEEIVHHVNKKHEALASRDIAEFEEIGPRSLFSRTLGLGADDRPRAVVLRVGGLKPEQIHGVLTTFVNHMNVLNQKKGEIIDPQHVTTAIAAARTQINDALRTVIPARIEIHVPVHVAQGIVDELNAIHGTAPAATSTHKSTAGLIPHGVAINLHEAPDTALGTLTSLDTILRRIHRGGTNVQPAINAAAAQRQGIEAKINGLRGLLGEIRIPIHMSRRILPWKR